MLFIAIVIGSTSAIMIMNQIWPGLIINLVVCGFICYVYSSTYYIISGNDLLVKSGFVYNKTIKIDTIKRIEETNSPLSSPGASLDRIAIYYNKSDSVMISPKDKNDLINHLISINGKIELILKNAHKP